MSFFYKKFQDLSDQSLLQRIHRKESFRKEAVIAAYQILKERGYSLDSPYFPLPEEKVCDDTKEEITTDLSSNKYHAVFKDEYAQIPIYKVVLFFGIFFCLLYYFNAGAKTTYLYKQINLSTELLIGLGSISYIIHLLLFGVIFMTAKGVRTSLISVEYSHFFVAVKVFLFSILVMFVLEILFADGFIINRVVTENSYRTFISSLLFGSLVAFTEELIFKRLLLTQFLIRIENNRSARVIIYLIVALLFAVSHIPKQIADYGDINYGHLFLTFLYSYFTTILFVRHNNFLLVVALHFFLNFTVIFLEDAGSFFGYGLILIGIYTIKGISNSFLFRVPEKLRQINKLLLLAICVLPFMLLFFIPRSYIDHYRMAKRYYDYGEKNGAEEKIDAALDLKSDHAKSLNLKGNLFYDRDKFQQALIYYDSSIQVEWKYGTIRNRGLANKALGNYNNCIDDLTKALDNGIISARVFENRGTCYLGVDEIGKAKTDFLNALDIKPHYKLAYYGLGRVYLKLKKYDSCAYYAKQALDRNANFVQGYEILSMAYTGLEKYDTAIYLMTKAIRMGSSNPTRFYLRGVNYYNREDFYNASIEFEKSLEILAGNPKLHLLLAYCYAYLKKPEKVCEQIKIAKELGYGEAVKEISERCKVAVRSNH